MVRLVLVRHGQTVANVAGLLETAPPGAELTPLGREQASDLVPRLRDEPIAAIVTSPLARTVATAAPLAAARGIVPSVDEGLREVVAGDLEGRADRDAHLAYLGVVLAWAEGDLDRRVPGSPQSGAEFLAGFDRAVEQATAGTDATVVCVSHGAAGRSWAASRASNLPGSWAADHGLPNCGIVVLERTDGAEWTAVEWQGGTLPDLDRDPTGAPVRA